MWWICTTGSGLAAKSSCCGDGENRPRQHDTRRVRPQSLTGKQAPEVGNETPDSSSGRRKNGPQVTSGRPSAAFLRFPGQPAWCCEVLLAICTNEAPCVKGAAFARTPPARAFRPASKIEITMEPGHGRLLLRDGTDLPIGYCLIRSQTTNGCRGILIGNIRSVDRRIFLKPIKIALNDGSAFVAHAIGHSERHVRFVTNLGQLISRYKSQIGRRGRPQTVRM